MTSIPRLLAATIALLVIGFAIILPLYTFLLAIVTILRSKPRRTNRTNTNTNTNTNTTTRHRHPWDGVTTSFFRGRVFHVRHRPTVHSFGYPLFFSVVDLDEGTELFGGENVRPSSSSPSPPLGRSNATTTKKEAAAEKVIDVDPGRGSLWPLSTLMTLRDVDHLKNGEGAARNDDDDDGDASFSTRERIENLVFERTQGKMDMRSTADDGSKWRRRILLVTHLMYYGYCFNPVSFYFIMKPNNENDARKDGVENEGEILEAVVIEISNTPWNEMSIYVMHPDSVDTTHHSVDAATETHRYKFRKGFHVSPFMTMDHDYDWRFRIERDRMRVEGRMIRRRRSDDDDDDGTDGDNNATIDGEEEGEGGRLYFVAGFDIERVASPTATYPLRLAGVIARFPIYCFVIQLWIHYEALRLLIKGVEFVPHPEGSETGASRAIASAMRPAFAAMDAFESWRRGGEVVVGGKSKVC